MGFRVLGFRGLRFSWVSMGFRGSFKGVPLRVL